MTVIAVTAALYGFLVPHIVVFLCGFLLARALVQDVWRMIDQYNKAGKSRS